jgi:hypothetical protein
MKKKQINVFKQWLFARNLHLTNAIPMTATDRDVKLLIEKYNRYEI